MTGGVSLVGDEMVRTALYEAANAAIVAGHAFLGAQALGNRRRQTAGHETGQSRLGAQDRRDLASDVGRRNEFPLDEGGAKGAATVHA